MEKDINNEVSVAIKQVEISVRDIINHLNGVIDHEPTFPRLIELLRRDLKKTIDDMMFFSPRTITAGSLKNLDPNLAELRNLLEKIEKEESKKIKEARKEMEKQHK